MRTKLYYSFLVLMVGMLPFTACDTANNNNNFEESFELFTDLDPVQGASNVTAVVNRGGDVTTGNSYVAGADSWFKIKLENVGSNDIINNGTVGAWCLEWKKPMRSSNDVHEGTKLYSTKGADKWLPMNYFFSIRNELKREDPTLTHREFQSVVWALAGDMGIAPEFDLAELDDSDLPSRLRENGNGKAIVNKEKVIAIVNQIKRDYRAKVSSITASPVVMETNGDEQDVIIPDPPPVIEEDTNIFIYFDSSGSMDDTLAPLQEMRDNLLRDALLPFYNDDNAIYDSRVNVIQYGFERTYQMFNIFGATPADGNVVVLVFQDEANNVYHGSSGFWSITDPRTFSYDSDLVTLRSRLDSFATNFGTNYYRGVLFQVTDDEGFGGPGFRELFQAVQNGDGNYSGVNGLSDRNEFNYVYDVADGTSANIYLNLVTQALTDLGFDLTP